MRSRYLQLVTLAIGLALPACGGNDEGDSADEVQAAPTSDAGGGEAAASEPSVRTDLDPEGMSFFVTSRGTGEKGGNVGGLEGADAICAELADAVGEGARTWRAYLCTTEADARDRIGAGPWFNSAGEKIADDVASLHEHGVSNDDPQHILDEHGQTVPGREHDISTGCREDGTVHTGFTCDDWTSSSPDDAASVGHSDISPPPFDNLTSWNAAHPSAGCDEPGLAQRLGSGRFYCFATDVIAR